MICLFCSHKIPFNKRTIRILDDFVCSCDGREDVVVLGVECPHCDELYTAFVGELMLESHRVSCLENPVKK